jgi:hypothetical protein
MVEENNRKIFEILIDLLYDLPVCGCADEAIEELENNLDFTPERDVFIKSLVEMYLEETCNACSDDVAEEFQDIMNGKIN